MTTRSALAFAGAQTRRYNNLLWANWGSQLANILLLGNQFGGYGLRDIGGRLRASAAYVHAAVDFVVEHPIVNSYVPEVVFNDLAYHCFPAAAMAQVLAAQHMGGCEAELYPPSSSSIA